MTLWHLYIVKCSDGTLYTGITTDPKRRLQEHNNGSKGAKYTRTRRPVSDMVVLGTYTEKSAALRAEHLFKKLPRRMKIMHMNESS